MNASTLRAGAALALVCLLPRVSALTIVQTTTINRTDSSNSAGGGDLGANWAYQTFNPALGSLYAVVLDVSYSVKTSTGEINALNSPFQYTPSVSFNYRFGTTDSAITKNGSAGASGPTVTLQPGQGVGLQATFVGTESTTFTTPLDLARFSGLAPSIVGIGGGAHTAVIYESFDDNSFFGGTTATGNTVVTLTYQYGVASVPDAANTAVVFALTIGLLGVAHRRRNRNRPTE